MIYPLRANYPVLLLLPKTPMARLICISGINEHMARGAFREWMPSAFA